MAELVDADNTDGRGLPKGAALCELIKTVPYIARLQVRSLPAAFTVDEIGASHQYLVVGALPSLAGDGIKLQAGGTMKKTIRMNEKEIAAFRKMNRKENLSQACRGPFWLRAWLISRFEEAKAEMFIMLRANYGIKPDVNISMNRNDYTFSYDDGTVEKPKRKAK